MSDGEMHIFFIKVKNVISNPKAEDDVDIFSAVYEKSVQGIPLAQAFKEFLQEIHQAELEIIKNGQKITL